MSSFDPRKYQAPSQMIIISSNVLIIFMLYRNKSTFCTLLLFQADVLQHSFILFKIKLGSGLKKQ